MSERNTKERILNHALKRFNESGYGAMNLLELAKSLDMSRGNMTYHFKDKEALLKCLSEELWQKLQVPRRSKAIPSFANLHHDSQLYYRLQREYSFIFKDNQVLSHPLVAPQMKAFAEQTIQDIEMAIAVSVQVGNMNPEPLQGTYKNLALTSWILMYFRSSKQEIRNNREKDDGERVIWSLLLPHLTKKGIAAFRKYFGDDYMNQLGDPFNPSLESYVKF